MVHGRTPEEADERVRQVRRAVHDRCGPVDHVVLYSTRVLKKSGLRLSRRAARNADPVQ